VIVNNSSEDNSIHEFENEFTLVIDAQENLGFGRGCNLGLDFIYKHDSQAIVWIINPDAYIGDDSLDKVKPFFELHPEVSILGTIIYTPEGKVWFAGGRFISKVGIIFTENLLINTNKPYINCDWISGCSLIINLSNFTECPLFDPAYFLYYEDFDFCRRYAIQGHSITITNQLSVFHQPSSITNKYIFRKTKHSTFSYLLTLQRYTDSKVLILRLLRLISCASILIFIKPQVSLGKFYGVFIYWKKFIKNYVDKKIVLSDS